MDTPLVIRESMVLSAIVVGNPVVLLATVVTTSPVYLPFIVDAHEESVGNKIDA